MALSVKKNTVHDLPESVNGFLLPKSSNNKLIPSFNSTADMEKLKVIVQDENKINPSMLLSDAKFSGSHTSVMSLV